MTLQSGWAYRQGGRELRKTREYLDNKKREQKKMFEENLPKIKEDREKREYAQNRLNLEMWEKLSEKDTLKFWGYPHMIIKKKNKKSIIMTDGGKLTQFDVFHL